MYILNCELCVPVSFALYDFSSLYDTMFLLVCRFETQKVKDYLAFPTSNGYKGLHSVVLMPLNDTPTTASDDDDDNADDDNDHNIESEGSGESNDLGLRRRRENREHRRRGERGSVVRNIVDNTGSGNRAVEAVDAATLVPIEVQLRTSSMDAIAMFGRRMASHMAVETQQRLRASSVIERRSIDKNKDNYGNASDDGDDSDDHNDGSGESFDNYDTTNSDDLDDFNDFGLPWLKNLPAVGRATDSSLPLSPSSMTPPSPSLLSPIVDNAKIDFTRDIISDGKSPSRAPPLPLPIPPPTLTSYSSLFPAVAAPTTAEQLAQSIASQLSSDRRFVFTSQV